MAHTKTRRKFLCQNFENFAARPVQSCGGIVTNGVRSLPIMMQDVAIPVDKISTHAILNHIDLRTNTFVRRKNCVYSTLLIRKFAGIDVLGTPSSVIR